MGYIKPLQLDKVLKGQSSPPIFLFAGDETYFLDLCLEKTLKALAADVLNKEVLYANESSMDEIFQAVQTVSFFGGQRIVVLKELQKIPPADAARLLQYVSNPTQNSCLILLYRGAIKNPKEIIARKKLLAHCADTDNCVCVDCCALYDKDVREFIKKKISGEGKTISYEAVSRIINENGTDLLNISNEIDKMVLFADKKKEITQDDIELISGYTKEINQYALGTHIEAKDKKSAVIVLEQLLAEGESAIKLLVTISTTVRRLLCAKSLVEQKGGRGSDLLPFNAPPFVKSTFNDNLKKHSLKELQEAMRELLKADITVKSSDADIVYSSLERLIIFLTT